MTQVLMQAMKERFLNSKDLTNLGDLELVNCNLQCIPYESFVVNFVYRVQKYDVIVSGPLAEDNTISYLYYTILSDERTTTARYLKDVFGSVYEDFKDAADKVLQEKFFSKVS